MDKRNASEAMSRSFPVSIKGVLLEASRVVLLENEREEWELPGGRLEIGEDPNACLVREFAEELGISVIVKAILDCWLYEVLPARYVVIITYGVERAGVETLRLSAEHRRLGAYPLGELDGLPMSEGYRRSVRAWAAIAVTAEDSPVRSPERGGASAGRDF